MTVLLVLLGGAVGAPARYLTDLAVQRRHTTTFPWGTWTVNVVGSFVLGVVVAAGPGWLVTLAGTGFCGALTNRRSPSATSSRASAPGSPPPRWAGGSAPPCDGRMTGPLTATFDRAPPKCLIDARPRRGDDPRTGRTSGGKP
jgi:CrcB protein